MKHSIILYITALHSMTCGVILDNLATLHQIKSKVAQNM